MNWRANVVRSNRSPSSGDTMNRNCRCSPATGSLNASRTKPPSGPYNRPGVPSLSTPSRSRYARCNPAAFQPAAFIRTYLPLITQRRLFGCGSLTATLPLCSFAFRWPECPPRFWNAISICARSRGTLSRSVQLRRPRRGRMRSSPSDGVPIPTALLSALRAGAAPARSP
jgi:hypothetical protein